jgi:tripartite-type tricarboxylate transporter receptor subunit TctC
MKKFTYLITLFPILCALTIGATTLQAQSYPSYPIRMAIVAGPGDASDTTSRLLGEELSKILKTPIIPINKPGAGSTLATDFVVKSKKDGYTILYGNSGGAAYAKAANPEDVPYDPIKDLEPLGLHLFLPSVIYVQAESPWKNFNDVVEYAKKNPGKFRCGLMGVGSIKHFQLEMIKAWTGVDITMIPFKAATPAVTAVLGGHMEAGFSALNLAEPHIESGKLRGILLDRKVPGLSTIPTLQESGYEKELPYAWFALFAPAGIPEEVRKVLVPAIEKAIKNSELKAKTEKLGFFVEYKPPEELKKIMINDYENAVVWAKKLGVRKGQ